MKKKYIVGLFGIFFVIIVYLIIFANYIPITKNNFKNYDEFLFYGYDGYFERVLPNTSYDIKYYFHQTWNITQKACCYKASVEDVEKLIKNNTSYENIVVKSNDNMYQFDGKKKINIDNNATFEDSIKPFITQYLKNNPNWYFLSLYEINYRNCTEVFGSIYNDENEIVQFYCRKTIVTR